MLISNIANTMKYYHDKREKEIYKVTFVGSLVNVLLFVFKFVAGIIGNSAAMIADSVHSLSDFITDVIVVVFVRISNKPEDKTHNYGHGKFETLATLLIGIILFFVGIGILWNGMLDIYAVVFKTKPVKSPGMVAFVAAIVSIILKEMLYQYSKNKGETLYSQTIIANAWHHRSDAFSSVGTAVGIGGAVFIGDRWIILDPIAAVVVSFFICKVAIHLSIPCFEELLEKSLPKETEHEILKY